MSDFDIWATIFLLTIATIVTRSSFFLLGGAVKLPSKLQHALRYAPAAALAAIVAPDLVLSGETLQITLMNPRLLAAAGAAAFFVATRHMLGTIGLGMLLYTGLRLFM